MNEAKLPWDVFERLVEGAQEASGRRLSSRAMASEVVIRVLLELAKAGVDIDFAPPEKVARPPRWIGDTEGPATGT